MSRAAIRLFDRGGEQTSLIRSDEEIRDHPHE
jgi:hypothetical protein